MNTTPDFYLKTGDTNPPLTITCTNSDGTIQDLTGATITFSMWRKTGVMKVTDQAASIVGTPTLGKVQYVFTATDSDTPGDFQGEFHVTLASGKKPTFPTGPQGAEYIDIRINPRIA